MEITLDPQKHIYPSVRADGFARTEDSAEPRSLSTQIKCEELCLHHKMQTFMVWDFCLHFSESLDTSADGFASFARVRFVGFRCEAFCDLWVGKLFDVPNVSRLFKYRTLFNRSSALRRFLVWTVLWFGGATP